VLALLLAAGCKTTSTTPPKSQLEIRELQTRSYETNDVKLVMKVLVSVLQDEGFLVQNSSTDLGLLAATKQIRVESEQDFGTVLPQLSPNVKRRKNSVLDANVVVSEYGTGCRVRVSFQIKMLSKSGKVRDAVAVDDAAYYQRFFSKVDKGLFLQAEKL
jgi:hypothetical protein